MVRGLEIFKDFFRDYIRSYILIGGAACDVLFTQVGLPFRATRDLDIVLVVEALTEDFVKRFWDFVKVGKYVLRQKGREGKIFYRFQKPRLENFPSQIELFARNPDLLDLRENSHLTPIPVEENLSSLSAILLDDDYYNFILTHSIELENLHLATVECLICFKAKAFLDMRTLKEAGIEIDSRDIRKHRNDVIRLSLLLREGNTVTLPQKIRGDMRQFLEVLQNEPPDLKTLGKSIGVSFPKLEQIIELFNQTFVLE